MAIEKMSLVNIVGSVDDMDRAMTACCDCGYFHPESATQYMTDFKGAALLQESNPYNPLIKRIVDLSYKLNFKLMYEDTSSLKLKLSQFDDAIKRIEEKYEHLRSEREELAQRVTQNEQALTQLQHMKGLAEKFDDIFACKAVSSRFGILPNDSYSKLDYYSDKPFFFFTFDVDEQYHWGVYFAPTVLKDDIDEIFRTLFFQRIRIPDYAHQTPDVAIINIGKMLEDYKRELKKADEEFKKLAVESRTVLRQMFSVLKFDSDSFELRKYVAVRNNQFVLVGFIPQKMSKAFIRLFDNIPSCDCVAREDNADPRLTPPVKLKNNWFTRPFEMFVTMYGLPEYGGFDPTPLVAYTYCFLFGMMFGDLGQGLLLSVIGLLMWRFKKMMLGRILARIGIFSALFGTAYGSVFGMEHLLDPLFMNIFGLPGKPIEVFNPETTNNLLLIAIGIGAVLITVSIVINIVLGLKKKDYERSVFGHNGIAGLVFYVSVIGAAALLMIFGVNVLNPVFIILCIVIPLLLIFLREPLSKWMAKKKDLKPEDGVGGFIITNFFELFENVLSYITNTVSFLRVGGFVLSHAGMMAVVLTLMEMIGGVGSPIVFVIGNLFVMAMEGLIVGIQVLRLEFYEIFSRFYEGDGKEFRPATVHYKIED
ncbi:MAG: V-type ATP synthase subunit I [Oscillospiraceae bacterium]|jgi:V/A-type H+-transporting ATPase subunit I